MAHTYYIALGSNVGDRERNLRRAWDQMQAQGKEGKLSSLYESEPMYVTSQRLFLNAAGRLSSQLSPKDMLAAIHKIEKDLGRDRSLEVRMGPRTVDLDILLCDDLVMEEPDLIIPHPRMSERGFVLVPLRELAPQLRDPRTGLPYAELPAASGQGVYSYPRR